MKISDYRVKPDEKVSLTTSYSERIISDEEDLEIRDKLYEEIVPEFQELQHKLFAQGEKGILIILQALDAAGKDEIIEYIFSTLMPQGLKVTSFGEPSEKEQAHDYMWRMQDGMPERGEIAILNRSYYEEIIAPKIHDILGESPLPDELIDESVWEKRYRQLKDFELYMVENGFPVIKFFFHMSKDEQKERLIERMTVPEKNYEFSFSDIEERQYWDDYQIVFEEMLSGTSTDYAPWYVLPADHEWASRYIATKAIVNEMKKLDLEFPVFTDDEKERAKKAIKKLENE